MNGIINEDPTAQKIELEFLRFFFDAAGEAFGPADNEIYGMIVKEYHDRGGEVPERYSAFLEEL